MCRRLRRAIAKEQLIPLPCATHRQWFRRWGIQSLVFLGAVTGGVFGILTASAFPEYASAHGAYTVMGMAGVAAAVLGAPICSVLVVRD